MALAMSSLPVPVSPRISTVVGHFATMRICSKMRRIGAECPTRLSKPYFWRTVRRRVSRSSDRAFALLLDLLGEAHALADQVGHHFDEARALFEQAVVGRVGLHRQHALQRAADLDRRRDERQVLVVDAEPVEKARLVAEARDGHGAAAFEDHADQAFAGLVAHRFIDSSLSSPCTA
jgi:hypothetical protein